MCFFKYSWRAVETHIFLTHSPLFSHGPCSHVELDCSYQKIDRSIAHILTFPQLPSLDNPSCGSSKHFCYLLWQKSHSLHLYCFIIFFCALFSLSLFSSSVSFNFIFACPNAYIENLWLFQIIFVRGFMAWIMRLIGTLLTRELFVPHCMNLWENSLPH